MAIRVNGASIEAEEIEYGVIFDDGFVAVMDDMTDAYKTAALTGGEVVARKVYCTAWAQVTT